MTFKAHFDGKTLIPDEPVELETGVSLVVSVKPAHVTGKGMTGQELVDWLQTEEPMFASDEEVEEFRRRIAAGREPRFRL